MDWNSFRFIDLFAGIGGIRIGFEAIKGLGEKTYQHIESNRPYSNFKNFLEKASGVKCNKKSIQLIIAGGLFNKLENSIAANDVHSNDQSITVVADSSNGGTNIEVNVDGTTIVKDGTSHALKSGLTLTKITTGLGTNVKEAYQLQNASGVQIGDQIDIYKDSALKEVYLGASTDTIDTSTGTITKNTVTGPQSMNFAYQLADGTYSLTKIDVSKFLTESEFGDGLVVTGGVVSVNTGDGLGINSTSNAVEVVTGNGIEIDTNDAVAAKIGNGLDFGSSNEIVVAIDSTSDTHGYLSVGADGVALDGNAIDQAIQDAAAGSATEITEKNTSATADTNDKYIKVVKTAGTNGQPDSYLVTTTGIDTAITNAIDALDGDATATAASGNVYTVLTGVSQTDGVISKGSEVTLAAVAKTGDAADVSYTNTTSGLTATNVQSAIDEIDGRLDALGTDALESVTSANAGIAVGTKSNHSQELTLTLDDSTVGTGSELTGTDNALTITNDGLFLSNIWDCGTY